LSPWFFHLGVDGKLAPPLCSLLLGTLDVADSTL